MTPKITADVLEEENEIRLRLAILSDLRSNAKEILQEKEAEVEKNEENIKLQMKYLLENQKKLGKNLYEIDILNLQLSLIDVQFKDLEHELIEILYSYDSDDSCK